MSRSWVRWRSGWASWWLELRGEPGQLMTLPAPEPDPERALLADEEIKVVASTPSGGRAPGR
jgi:hypothetical protein